MSKLLIVEESTILCGIFKRLLEQDGGFKFDVVQTYKEAKDYLSKYRYEFSVVSRTLSDASNGEVISLLNKHNVAPIVYTTTIDEDFMESFESAHIVEYILRHRYDNVKYVVSRLNQLRENKKTTILIAHKSEIYRRYIKQNLTLHNFKVITVESAYEAVQKLEVHPEIRLLILNPELGQVNGLEEVNGLELTRRVRKMKLDTLKIITLAEESNSYETSYFLNEGADDYLINQYSRDEFYIRIYQNLKD
ncbi:response regulator [Sulfurimonas sp. SAG-AH-194-I05]|nr:response regulator [Sulfurimonas sp. SAG-AH-194-I05]MDF1874980.1 response regulator [Sulfurimonas sp. SAG-AH-194-I05]